MQKFVARYRIGISRVVFALIVLLILLSRHAWPEPGLFTLTSGTIGFICIIIAALGRLWCSIYICGYKNKRVIQEGPYSMVRNPLYFFSLIGAVGIGLTTHSLVITGLLLIFFVGIYPMTVANEEDKLESMLGEAYTAYKARTPRFVPSLSLYSNVEQYTINIKQMQNAFLDAMWFFLGYGALQVIDAMQRGDTLPVLAHLR